jgi:hypothetical protein
MMGWAAILGLETSVKWSRGGIGQVVVVRTNSELWKQAPVLPDSRRSYGSLTRDLAAFKAATISTFVREEEAS